MFKKQGYNGKEFNSNSKLCLVGLLLFDNLQFFDILVFLCTYMHFGILYSVYIYNGEFVLFSYVRHIRIFDDDNLIT